VRSVLEKLTGAGLQSVSLLVGSENRRAINVYEDVGFEKAGLGPSDPRRPGELMLMRARLESDSGLE
jgi:ribosomal protein S18 acetylase RimI-like enzyme